MEEFYRLVPFFLPAWFIAALAFVAAAECIGLSLYLMYSRDHLVLHAADLGILGFLSAVVGLHYALIIVSPDYARGVAISRISWSLFFGINVIIYARYTFAIKHMKPVITVAFDADDFR